MSKLKTLLVALLLSSIPCGYAAAPPDSKPSVSALEKASFAEGCFWKTQYVFSKVPGVVKTTVGYSGGTIANPTYEQVCTHTTGHAESCLVEYDPAKTSYKKLLQVFFSSHNPTTKDRQGPDRGTQYRSV
ncbi:MAG: peptide-methionine (S)-S-oxide reductase MsrA, partial [Candidatus Obscuribacterales bacterium]|nr:peptide-methionine (S)-S-oxide reductase MsrA [Candidatus Obscuribacterales bacterium]